MKYTIISFNTAKLAKEKGFNILQFDAYDTAGEVKGYLVQSQIEEYFQAPPQVVLQRWLREEHNIEVWAQPYVYDRSVVYDDSVTDGTYSYFIYKDKEWKEDEVNFEKFEEALEIGLQKALELL